MKTPDIPEGEGEWLHCGCGFIEADVIRYQESIWERRGPRTKTRSVRIGERTVIAEVLSEDGDGWVYLRVLRSRVTWKKAGFERNVRALSEGLETKRKRKTISRKEVTRLAWSDESVRAAVVAELDGPGLDSEG